MTNKEVDQLIRACGNCQLVNSLSREVQQILHIIYSDAPFDFVFLDFWEPGDMPDRDGYRKIMTCLDGMIGSGLGSARVLKEITP